MSSRRVRFRAVAARGGQRFTPGVAWKMTEMPDGSGVMMLHQRGVDDEVQPVVGGYGGPDACNGIVHPAVTMVSSDGSVHSGPAMAGLVLAVDMAISADGKRVAVVSAGNATNTFVSGPATSPALPQRVRVGHHQRHRRRRRLPARRDARPVQPRARRDADLRRHGHAEAYVDR